MTSWNWPAGRSPSPTPRRSRAWPHWPARPTGSTPGCWPSFAAATWSPRSGCPRGPGRAGTGPVPAAAGPPPDRAQEPHPRYLAGLRQALSGQRPVRRRRPSTAGPPGAARAVDRQHHRGPGLIDDLDERVADCERDLRHLGADHPDVPLLRTAPGIAWVLGYTIAAELGDITRFSSPKKAVRLYRAVSRGGTSPAAAISAARWQERPALSALALI